MISSAHPIQLLEETQALEKFKAAYPHFFQKSETKLLLHLSVVTVLLLASTFAAVNAEQISVKIVFGMASSFLWFCLMNVTLHHHLTHRNAASSSWAKRVMDFLYFLAVPNAPKRRSRYTRAHLNHHFRPFHETDVDHHYGAERYLRMKQNPVTLLLYFLELTFVGAHVPGWEDDRYMNQEPLETWNRQSYEAVKKVEQRKAIGIALIQWGGFIIAVMTPSFFLRLEGGGLWRGIVPAMANIFAWGWAFPMLLVKNWAHFLGQFQHYKMSFLTEESSLNRKTKSYHVPGWLNYLTGGEISGHFLHHLYPEMPYYHVEEARRKFTQDSELARLFVIY